MNEKDYLFFDIEVFLLDSFVVFKDINKKLIRVFHNNFTGIADLIKDKILVGFNNYWYDDKILTYMIEGKSQYLIKQLNDKIINGENTKYINKPKFKSLDTFQQIDPSRPSLKKIEGNMGRLILESSIDFSIDRALSNEEFLESLEYCNHDVDTVIDIFKERLRSYFQPKQSLIDMLGNENAMKWNTTTISANLLLKNALYKWSGIRISEEMMQLVPEEVRELWEVKKKGSVTIEAFGCDIQFGYGGLHGCHKTIKRARNVKLLDVASMYPSIILMLNVLGKASGKYKQILDRRLLIKHTDPILSDALKLILNSVFGLLNNQYSLLHNPAACESVCIFGQIALFELCKRLHPFVEIVNINTDGVAFVPHNDGYIVAYEEWQQDFKLQLEEKFFPLFHQKDVNNYIAVKPNGDLICKGADVNRYKEQALFKNANARILDICLVNKLVYNKDVSETLIEHLDQAHLFQYVLKAGGTYRAVVDEKGNVHNKVNRVFAAKKEGFCLFKQRQDGGLVRFADAPTNMYLHNEDCRDIEDLERILDLNHYLQLVNKRLERWCN